MHQAIMGDLNTMAHGVARLSPSYCCDQMRWRSLCWFEADWWHRHVLFEVWLSPSMRPLSLSYSTSLGFAGPRLVHYKACNGCQESVLVNIKGILVSHIQEQVNITILSEDSMWWDQFSIGVMLLTCDATEIERSWRTITGLHNMNTSALTALFSPSMKHDVVLLLIIVRCQSWMLN